MVDKKHSRIEAEESGSAAVPPRVLVENLRELIEVAEKMIVDTASAQVDETVAELRDQLEEKLDRLRTRYDVIEERILSTAAEADASIREKPYQALGIAAGVGVLIGLLLGRRK
jgi:ElaB/YqjD/DUF883 family membrane-anchored ribosome-binding protein